MDKLLGQFLAVVEAGTLSGAATALLVTQPTLTFNMRKLEDSLGMALLIRTPRGIKLTEYGETLYHNAVLMRRLYDNTLEALEQQRARLEHGLRIGSGYSWWAMFIRDMVIDYSRRYPNARIHVSLGNQLRCMDQLLSGDISLFVGHEIDGLNHSIGARLIPLTRAGQAYFVREGHPLLGQPRRLAEVEAYPAVTSALPEVRHQRFFEPWSHAASRNVPFDQNKYVFASNSLAACLDYVMRTDAVIGHTDVMADEFVRRGIARIALAEPARESTIGIYVLEERASEPRVAALIEWLRDAAGAVLPRFDEAGGGAAGVV